MPAIQLSQLRQRCAQLAEQYDQPEVLVSDLHALLSSYADRTHRTGQTGEPPPLLPSYNVPKPVLRQVQLELRPQMDRNKESAYQLCDLLWKEDYYEIRLLAVTLLGQISPDPPAPILDRVTSWSKATQDEQLRRVIFDEGLSRLRLEAPDRLISLVEDWLDDPDPKIQRMGLIALNPLIRTAAYANIPTFFRQISPFVQMLSPQIRDEVRATVQSLAKRSPKETAHFLTQYLTLSNNQDAAWLTRQCIDYFPTDQQESLRGILRALPKD